MKEERKKRRVYFRLVTGHVHASLIIFHYFDYSEKTECLTINQWCIKILSILPNPIVTLLSHPCVKTIFVESLDICQSDKQTTRANYGQQQNSVMTIVRTEMKILMSTLFNNYLLSGSKSFKCCEVHHQFSRTSTKFESYE